MKQIIAGFLVVFTKQKILTVLRSYTLTVFLLGALTVSAQRYPYEISIYGGGGYAAFIIQKPVSKPASKGFGLEAGVGFTGFFSQNLGIHTSVGFGFFNTTNRLNSLSFVTPDQKNDCDDNLYDLHTTLNNYRENHKTMFVGIPVMLQYQTKMQPISYRQKNNRAGFYAMGGAKALLMVQNSYTAEVATLYNAAYYPQFKNWISYQPAMGLGVFKGNSVNNKLKINILAMFALEAGFKWKFGKKLLLYTGAYFDCGLHDTTKKQRISYNQFISQESLTDLELIDFAKRMNLMAAGVKLRFAFEVSKKTSCCR